MSGRVFLPRFHGGLILWYYLLEFASGAVAGSYNLGISRPDARTSKQTRHSTTFYSSRDRTITKSTSGREWVDLQVL